MSQPIKNLLVGVFVVAAVAIFVGIIMFLKPTIGDGKQTLYVRFSDIGNLSIGTRVLFSGKPVGEVVALEEIPEARQQPTDELGRVYFYQLTLHIDSSVKVYNTDELSVQSAGFLGEKSIMITPKTPPKGITPILITIQPIYANCVDSFQTALMDFSGLANSMEDTFRNVNGWIKSHGEEVASTICAGGECLNQIDQTFASVNNTKLVEHVEQGVMEINRAIVQVQDAMDAMEQKHTFENAGLVMESLKGACRSAEKVTHEVAEGKGTIGKLVNNDDLYLQANAMLIKANSFMNDLNQYGLLYNLNKQWQRTHIQKASKMSALSSPQSFRSYFEDEINQINSSMTRISMVVEKANNSPEKERILKSTSFQKDFNNLMRRCNELSETIKLYNEQFLQAKGE